MRGVKHHWPARACPICGRQFTPKREAQRACGFRCSRALAGRTMKPRGTPAALVQRQQLNRLNRRRHVEAACRERFGHLTARDIQLFNFAAAEGYRRGYLRGYHALKRRYVRKGAA